jgi:CubicO group peptidase (beta-lactamase class C family)
MNAASRDVLIQLPVHRIDGGTSGVIVAGLVAFCLSGCTGVSTDRRAGDSFSAAAANQPVLPDSGELAAAMAPVFAEGMAKEGVPGAVVVLVADGRVVFAQGYGVAGLASRRPVDPATTIFPIASISKVFTATAVMQLADRGRLDLHADVNRYLTSARMPSKYGQPITAAHLLSHTSGLDELPGRRVRSTAELVPLGKFLATRLVRVHPPGIMTSYSTFGIALAGLLVEDVTHQPLEQYLAHDIWGPLGMTRTFITVPDSLKGDLATAYELDDGTPVPIPYELYQTPPASSIVSTALDMARFMVAHLARAKSGGRAILSDSAAELMQRQQATMHPRVPGWSYGFQLGEMNGQRILEHGGDIGGFSSLLVLLPDRGIGLFVAHHLESTNLRFDVKQAVLDQLFPDHSVAQAPVARPQDAERLRRFAGAYRANTFCHSCPDGGPNVQDFEVRANDDGTIAVWDQSWVPVDSLYFASLDGRRHIGFAEDSSGRIIALTAGSWKVLERIR